ncbi:glucose 1-dehydrogenase [uncultured Abyssibacter sp.]|uniref:SDR family NAD(P)-dependent oxidoreductase n=1 Tax=uncultured Abyssibacter sp. TaxID=2320202 RepID=UPI0032B1DF44
MPSLAGKTATVTGGASGIGLATARRLAADGANIAIWDINAAAAQTAADELTQAGHQAIASKVDVSSRADVDAAMAQLHDAFGPVSILVNNAGITLFRGFMDMDEDAWDQVMRINLKSMLVCTQAVIPDMLAAGWGRVINVSSSSAQTGSAGMAAYAASKGGVIGFTKAMAQEFADKGITVNNVPPGFVDTPMLRGSPIGSKVDAIAAASPMKRSGQPEDMAAAIAFLASEEAGYITGHTLSVNGGRYSN